MPWLGSCAVHSGGRMGMDSVLRWLTGSVLWLFMSQSKKTKVACAYRKDRGGHPTCFRYFEVAVSCRADIFSCWVDRLL